MIAASIGFVLGAVMAVWVVIAILLFIVEALIAEVTNAKGFFFWLGWPVYLVAGFIREASQ